ncbi:GNAT family N-acetyltransferase [Kineococcus sp. SYSU DK002]|uniref:GNAT family N-acetyltransferase n=1 Tax=Kineococcus sp. SYSU DK002 TaxID=3383123 RepID=UPI003D7CD719
MANLTNPRVGVAASLRAAAAEPGWEEKSIYAGAADRDDDAFTAWVDELIDDARDGSPRPDGFVPSTNLWWVQGDQYLGRVQIRHRLTPFLRDFGGHIGYYVVPRARRRGHATAILAAALPVAAALGIECALVTCDVDNTASRKTIEANGGLFQDQRGPMLRYWVPTGPALA